MYNIVFLISGYSVVQMLTRYRSFYLIMQQWFQEYHSLSLIWKSPNWFTVLYSVGISHCTNLLIHRPTRSTMIQHKTEIQSSVWLNCLSPEFEKEALSFHLLKISRLHLIQLVKSELYYYRVFKTNQKPSKHSIFFIWHYSIFINLPLHAWKNFMAVWFWI